MCTEVINEMLESISPMTGQQHLTAVTANEMNGVLGYDAVL